MTKYKEYAQKMMQAHPSLFADFRKIHDQYALEGDRWQEEFNRQGEKVLNTIREWENRLCLQSEKGGYSLFTGNLSEKFRQEIKKTFPMLDYVGIIVKKPPKKEEFIIRKIKL